MSEATFDLSVVIVSFNTRDVLRRCIASLYQEIAATPQYSVEVIVVDNVSRDNSSEMVAAEFPQVRLIQAAGNFGFAAANNLGFCQSHGRYIMQLNSDAFMQPGALRLCIEHMDANPLAGVGGARLIGEDGELQPSARRFPTPFYEVLMHTGLAAKFPNSRLFGRADRTWADPLQPALVDWVPGAFSILRRSVLDKTGMLDEGFFFYYDDVDICRRVRNAGYQVWYWPDIVVVHIGGESARQMGHMQFSSTGSQLTHWRMRSMLLYHRKHHGVGARIMRIIEGTFYRLRALHNQYSSHPEAAQRVIYNKAMATSLRSAWRETRGGRIPPQRPW